MGFTEWLGKKLVERGIDIPGPFPTSSLPRLLVDSAVSTSRAESSPYRLATSALARLPGFQAGDEIVENVAIHFAAQDLAVQLTPCLRKSWAIITRRRTDLLLSELAVHDPTISRARAEAILTNRTEGHYRFLDAHFRPVLPATAEDSGTALPPGTMEIMKRITAQSAGLLSLTPDETVGIVYILNSVIDLYRRSLDKVLASAGYQVRHDLT